MGKFDTYKVSDDDAVSHGGRLGAGDEYPFLTVTRDADTGAVYGYVFTPSGIHYTLHPDSAQDDDDDDGRDDAAEPASSSEAPSSRSAAGSPSSGPSSTDSSAGDTSRTTTAAGQSPQSEGTTAP